MRTLIKELLIFSSCILAIIVFANIANACSCGAKQTIDKEFARSSNIVILKLQSVKELTETEKSVPSLNRPSAYFLTVEQIYKGNLKVGETLKFQPGFACSWTFDKDDVGNEYLFYLNDKPKNNESWIANYCSRSGSLRSRSSDLIYLQKEKAVRNKTRLSGTLIKLIEIPNSESRFNLTSLPNRKVKIIGKGNNIELLTNKNGAYEIYDLPSGKYKIIPEKIDGYKSSSFGAEFSEVEIKAKSHTEEDFYYEIDNAVSGKVINNNGKPLQYVCLDLIPVRNEKAKDYSKASCTSKNGEFEISSIPPGTYILAINKDGEIRQYEPFNTFYYPNVKNKEEATEITIDENYFLRDLIITPLEMIETVTLSGVLTYKDGKPVVNETVNFISDKEIFRTFDGKIGSDYKDYTDENGRFTFTIWKGQKGVLRSSMFSFVGEYENCPEIDNLVRQRGEGVQQIDAQIDIDATENLDEIELKFPFSKCEERNEN